MPLIDAIVADAAELTAVRRDLHAHPELGFEEHRTADVIARLLEGWGLRVHRGLGGTGVVGELRHGSSSRALGLRADIDALPITETNGFAHASRHPGRMHACGHDGHTAMLLAGAKHLARTRNFDGTVYFVFQPAEEGGGGAREMIRDGIFDRFAVDAIFGAHNWPGLPAGQFALTPGPCFASSNTFTIAIEGRGGHAAMPHLNVDPIPAACQLVQALQTVVSRNVRPIDGSVLSVTMVHAGEADNVTPERCTLGGTVRAFSGQVLDVIEQRMRTIAESTSAAFGCGCRFEFVRGYPPTVNHERETGFVRQVLAEVAGPGHVHDFEPTMGAEDFSYFLEATPGCYFLIGAGDGSHRAAGHGPGPAQLHNPSYDFNDALIPVGGTAWARLAESWLAPR